MNRTDWSVGGVMSGLSMSTVNEDDVKMFAEILKEFEESDKEVQRDFYISIGFYDSNGNIAERYRSIFPGKRSGVLE